MNTINVGRNGFQVPQIGLGCFRIAGMEPKAVRELIEASMEEGANFFEHANIYGAGKCESLFAEALDMNPSIRETMFIQSKCGIVGENRPIRYFDFSKENIISSTEGSLSRLKTDYLDSLVLHRPDALMEPEEVAEAFSILKEQGKVRHFGVSNHTPSQIELLRKYCDVDIEFNQLQFSITESGMIDTGLYSNMHHELGINRDESTLDYCRLHDITIQAWSPFQYGFFEGCFIDSPVYPELNAMLQEFGDKYGVSKTTIATAWINRHPARMQTLAGTTKKERLREICQSTKIELTREEWYRLYLSTGKKLP